MYQFLLNTHSGLRYIVLALLVTALFRAIIAWLGRKNYLEHTQKINLFAMISVHIQFLLGLLLYFYSPFVKLSNMAETMRDPMLRYWTVEHFSMMLLAMVLITLGYSRSKRATNTIGRHRSIVIFYGLALLVIWLAIVQSGRHL